MDKVVGLWIDTERAVIFTLANEGAEIKRIRSEIKNDISPLIRQQKDSALDQGEKGVIAPMNDYYSDVISAIRSAESILIFGPGEAKLELTKRLENLGLQDRIVGVETVFKMTDNEIVMKVRRRFLN